MRGGNCAPEDDDVGTHGGALLLERAPGACSGSKIPRVYRPFMEECRTFSRSLFFTAAYFHFALVAASTISHFITAATKFSCCSFNKKMSPLFFFSHSFVLDLCRPFSR